MSDSESDSGSLGSYSIGDDYDVEVFHIPDKKYPFDTSDLPDDFDTVINKKLDKLEDELDSKKKEQEFEDTIKFSSGKKIKVRFVITKTGAQSSDDESSNSEEDEVVTNGKSGSPKKKSSKKDSDED